MGADTLIRYPVRQSPDSDNSCTSDDTKTELLCEDRLPHPATLRLGHGEHRPLCPSGPARMARARRGSRVGSGDRRRQAPELPPSIDHSGDTVLEVVSLRNGIRRPHVRLIHNDRDSHDRVVAALWAKHLAIANRCPSTCNMASAPSMSPDGNAHRPA